MNDLTFVARRIESLDELISKPRTVYEMAAWPAIEGCCPWCGYPMDDGAYYPGLFIDPGHVNGCDGFECTHDAALGLLTDRRQV